MRERIGGAILIMGTAAGVAFVLAGRHPSHVGPCLGGTCPIPTVLASDDYPQHEEIAGEPSAPRRLPILNFEEPPYSPVVPASATIVPDYIPPAE